MKIKVRVKPNAREEFLEKLSDGTYLAGVKAPALKGKANSELAKLIAKKFRVSTKEVIIKTPKAKFKIIQIKI